MIDVPPNLRVELRVASAFTPALYLVTDEGEVWLASNQAGLSKAKSLSNLTQLRNQGQSIADLLGVELVER